MELCVPYSAAGYAHECKSVLGKLWTALLQLREKHVSMGRCVAASALGRNQKDGIGLFGRNIIGQIVAAQ